MNSPESSQRGVLAGMYGPTFYELLSPLVQQLFHPFEIETQQAWMKTESGKTRLVSELLRRVQNLHIENERQKQAIESWKTNSQSQEQLHRIKDSLYLAAIDDKKELETRLEKMQAEIKMCRRHPIIVERPYDENVILPQTPWMNEWRARQGFDKQSAILRIIGETGLGRLPDLRERAAAEFGYKSPIAGGITKAIEALQRRGLVSIRQAEGGMQGRPPKLVWLTDLGQAAYVMLTNQPPLKSELDSHSSHVSDAHMLLNLEAEGWLERDGYEILARAYRYFLDGIRQAVPDLTVRKNGQVSYIEVERSGKKSSRPEKWINMHELTGGNIFVFCQYDFSQQQIAREVAKALSERGLSSRLTLTNLEWLRRGPAGRLWLEEIDIFPGMILPGD